MSRHTIQAQPISEFSKSNSSLPQKISDSELIDLFRRGSRQAGKHLFQRYYKTVVTWALFSLQSPEDAQDAAQDVFAKVIAQKAILKYRGESLLKTWLYRVTFNVCQSHWRHKMTVTKYTLPDNSMLPGHGLSSDNPEDHFIQNEEKISIQHALQALPPMYRDVIRARYFEDVPYATFARDRGISVHTLRVHLLRGKKKLRQFLHKTTNS